MTTLPDARQFLVDLISQLFHADVLITEQAERIEALEADVARLRGVLGDKLGAAAWSGRPGNEPYDVTCWTRLHTIPPGRGGPSSRYFPGEFPRNGNRLTVTAYDGNRMLSQITFDVVPA